MHALLSLHQPHAAVVVHASHALAPAHSSVTQALETHFQSLHVPSVGPVDVPVMHAALVSHQPQPASMVHVPHEA
jgi:hypothetical protein